MVYLSESGQGGWGEVVLPSPSSEPPPPYSPPRVSHHHHFFPQGFPHHHIYHAITEYYDLTSSQPSSLTSHDTASIKDPPPPYPPTTTLKTAHAALNHGPSSAFSPPTKTIKYSYPPPYTPADSNSSGRVKIPQPQVQQQQDPVAPGNRGLASDPRHRSRRLHPPRHQQNISSLDERYRINEDDSRSSGGSRRVPAATTDRHGVYPASSRSVMGSGHPRGPLLRTGKSLELPHERLTQHHPPPTAHTHPRHLHHSHHRTKDTSGHHRTKEPFGTNTQSKSNQLAYVGILPCKPSRVRDKVVPPVDLRGSNRCEEQWMTRASRLEAAAARTMMAARAVPVTAVNNHAHSLEYENNMMRGRLRSCRSLDELSDLLDEEASIPRHHPVVTRSLDDLTEPLYENFDIINAHARRTHERTKHNTSVPDLLEPPPRPPRQRNSSLSSLLEVSNSSAASLSRRALNTSVPDVLEGGGLSWGSPTSTLRSTASTSAATFDRDAMSDISVQLQKIREVARVLGVKYRRGELSSSSASSSGAGSTHTSPRMPPHALTPPPHVPGVPARAPVIHDVLKEGKKLSPPQQVHPRTTTLTRDTDATSQESGYGSVDSRSHRLQQFYFHHPQSHVGKQQQHLREHPHLSKAQQQLSNSSQLASTQYQLEKNESSPGSSQLQRNCPRLAQVTSQSQRQQSFQSRDSLQNPQQSSTFPTQYSQHQLDNLQQHAQHHQQKLHQKHQQRNHHLQWHQAAKQKQPIQQLELHQGVNQDKLGIYIKSVVPGGAADQDGRLQAGDQLLSVDGKSLIGITQERAAEYMMETGPVVTLEVARQGAIYHGLATILSQPSPHVNRASLRKMRPRAEEAPRAAMTNSQSTPNMGGYNERLVDWNQPPRQHPLPPTSSHSSVMARSSPNLAAPVEGYPGGRHLSERDLPSKVLSEHNQDPPAPSHLHQAPRMQASKSVPSLNSEAGSSVGGKPASLEVFNPSYSRTSSNTSLSQPPNPQFSHHPHHHQQPQQQQQQQQLPPPQQQQQPPVRSRSTQNLSDGSYPGLVGRHPSNPSLVVEEERYYQNVNFHQGPQDSRMGSIRTRPIQALPMSSPASQDSSEHVRPDPRADHRPASAFLQREDLIQHRSELHRPASQRELRADAKMLEMTEEVRRREERARHNGHPSSSLPHRSSQNQPPHHVPNSIPTASTPFSPDGYNGIQGLPNQHTAYHHTQSQPLSPQGTVTGLQQIPRHAHPQYSTHGQNLSSKLPPPTAPKPKSQSGSQGSVLPEAPEKPSRQFGYEGSNSVDGPPRPPPPEEGYRESPPPPPPPTSTHPLLQGNRPASTVGPSSQLPSKSAFNKTSPWDREQKELHDRRRREAARHWRDEQISSLESLPVRTSQQDERLRTLRLEREFQRRAEEALTNEDEDEDDGDDDDDDDVEVSNDNEVSLRQGSQDSIIREYSKPSSTASIITSGQESRMNGGGPADEERARKVDEIRRKQQELEAAREVEERLLREAQRRQQEEQMRRFQQQHQEQQQQQLQQQQLQQQQLQQQQLQQQQLQQQLQQGAAPQHPLYQHQHHATQRLDTLVATPFHTQYSNGPINGIRGSHNSYPDKTGISEVSHRLDTGTAAAQHSPIPPERGSSYSIMQQQTTVTTQPGTNNRYKGQEVSSATIKRVQFSETTAVDAHITYDNNANQEKTPRQDPNNFINEAETLMNSSPTRIAGGSTPGVIGAQEVYRDPRMRRLQQKQAEQAAAKNPGPEKLTFKEKMKMFAMETGEAETPKDKVKISRAQRDIEH